MGSENDTSDKDILQIRSTESRQILILAHSGHFLKLRQILPAKDSKIL